MFIFDTAVFYCPSRSMRQQADSIVSDEGFTRRKRRKLSGSARLGVDGERQFALGFDAFPNVPQASGQMPGTNDGGRTIHRKKADPSGPVAPWRDWGATKTASGLTQAAADPRSARGRVVGWPRSVRLSDRRRALVYAPHARACRRRARCAPGWSKRPGTGRYGLRSLAHLTKLQKEDMRGTDLIWIDFAGCSRMVTPSRRRGRP